MTGLIVVDESGDLGSAGSEYFAMAALILMRPRHLKSVLGVFPKMVMNISGPIRLQQRGLEFSRKSKGVSSGLLLR